MLSIIENRRLTPKDRDLAQQKRLNPEKFDIEFEFLAVKKQPSKRASYRNYTMEEVQSLLEASRAETRDQFKLKRVRYEPLDRELVEQLVREYTEYKRSLSKGGSGM